MSQNTVEAAKELQKIKTNIKRARGTMDNIIENFDVDTFSGEHDVSHLVQQIDSVVGYLMSARKDLVDFSLSTCVECADLDRRLKEQLMKKLEELNKLKK